MPVVGVHGKAHARRVILRLVRACRQQRQCRLRAHGQPRPVVEVVEAELQLGILQRHVGAALHVGGAATRVVDRLAVHRDTHHVEPERVTRAQLARQAGDVHALVAIQHGQLVVHHLHRDERLVALDEAGVDHVFGVHVAAPLVLRLRRLEAHAGADGFHGAAGAGRRQADVVAVDPRGAPVQALVAGVADEFEPHVVALADVVHRAPQHGGVAGRQDCASLHQLQRRNASPGRIVDPCDQLGAGVLGAELRFIRQLLQRVVVPEFHLDAPVQRPALQAVIGRQRLRRAAAVTVEHAARQAERVLDRQPRAQRPGAGIRKMIAVNARRPAGQRRIVGEADQLHGDVLLVAQVVQRLRHGSGELSRDPHHLFVPAQRRDQVAHPGAPRVAFLVAQLADRFHATDLDPLDVLCDQHLLAGDGVAHLVVPDLHLDAPVLRAAGGAGVAGDRPRVAGPFEGDGFRRQAQRHLEEFGHLAGALARQPGVIAVDPRQRRRQRLVVGMPDQVQAHVAAVLHAVQHPPQGLDVARRDVRHAGLEADRRHHVRQLHRLDFFRRHLAQFEPVAGLGAQWLRIDRPFRDCFIWRQVAFHRLRGRGPLRVQRQAGQALGDRRAGAQQQAAALQHGAHLPSPRRQNISDSTLSG